MSKIGEINLKKDFGKIVGLYSKDVLTEFLKQNQERYNTLDKHESKAVNKFMNKFAMQLINDSFDMKS